jgi:hypothetical protein
MGMGVGVGKEWFFSVFSLMNEEESQEKAPKLILFSFLAN